MSEIIIFIQPWNPGRKQKQKQKTLDKMRYSLNIFIKILNISS